jgi:uncharacterized protein YndB with AHSA1/START domain
MSTANASETAVSTSITVEAPLEVAFETFTAGMAGWWNPEHHIIEAPLAEMVFEPRAGGHIYDRGTDGSVCRWATVLAYEPPQRLLFIWNIGLDWKLQEDPERVSEVEVRSTAQGDERTLVELEHRHIDRHGEGWEGMRGAVGSPGGWPGGLQRFAEQVAG